MKPILFSALFSAVALGSLTCAAESYPILCRSGVGITVFSQRTYQTMGGGDVGSNASEQITFKRNDAAARADGSGLKPGTCAWVDRPLNASEPNIIIQTLSLSSAMIVTYNTGSGTTIVPAVSQLDNDAYPGKIFRAYVQNMTCYTGKPCLWPDANKGLTFLSNVQ